MSSVEDAKFESSGVPLPIFLAEVSEVVKKLLSSSKVGAVVEVCSEMLKALNIFGCLACQASPLLHGVGGLCLRSDILGWWFPFLTWMVEGCASVG